MTSQTTIRLHPRDNSGLYLLVMDEGRYQRHSLPATGVVTIGRAEDADIQIDHASVSRHHARIHTSVGTIVTIEDLGSSNHTKLRDTPLVPNQRVRLERYDVVEIGGVPTVFQVVDHNLRYRRFLTRDELDRRIDRECARAEERKTGFSLLSISAPRQSERDALRFFLTEALDDDDSCTELEDGGIEVLLRRQDPMEFKAEIDASAALASSNFVLHSVTFPSDGDSPARLQAALRMQTTSSEDSDALVSSDSMVRLYSLASRVAKGSISVLIVGETGTGKQVLAEHLHRQSQRGDKPMVEINCAALPDDLLESELFGHVKGAFTGALRDKKGLMTIADGGTLFLDEIGDMSVHLQAKLLKVLEDGIVRPVGGLEGFNVDLRIIAATNAQLEESIADGLFREDLYYRLSGIRLDIPPLRRRQDDVLPLFRRFHEGFCKQLDKQTAKLSPAAEALILEYSWPGNIRELRNVAERATLLCQGGRIDVRDLPTERWQATVAVEEALPSAARGGELSSPTDKVGAQGGLTKESIIAALEKTAGNQTRAARELKVSRRTLTKWMSRFGLPRPRKPSPW